MIGRDTPETSKRSKGNSFPNSELLNLVDAIKRQNNSLVDDCLNDFSDFNVLIKEISVLEIDDLSFFARFCLAYNKFQIFDDLTNNLVQEGKRAIADSIFVTSFANEASMRSRIVSIMQALAKNNRSDELDSYLNLGRPSLRERNLRVYQLALRFALEGSHDIAFKFLKLDNPDQNNFHKRIGFLLTNLAERGRFELIKDFIKRETDDVEEQAGRVIASLVNISSNNLENLTPELLVQYFEEPETINVLMSCFIKKLINSRRSSLIKKVMSFDTPNSDLLAYRVEFVAASLMLESPELTKLFLKEMALERKSMNKAVSGIVRKLVLQNSSDLAEQVVQIDRPNKDDLKERVGIIASNLTLIGRADLVRKFLSLKDEENISVEISNALCVAFQELMMANEKDLAKRFLTKHGKGDLYVSANICKAVNRFLQENKNDLAHEALLIDSPDNYTLSKRVEMILKLLKEAGKEDLANEFKKKFDNLSSVIFEVTAPISNSAEEARSSTSISSNSTNSREVLDYFIGNIGVLFRSPSLSERSDYIQSMLRTAVSLRTELNEANQSLGQ